MAGTNRRRPGERLVCLYIDGSGQQSDDRFLVVAGLPSQTVRAV